MRLPHSVRILQRANSKRRALAAVLPSAPVLVGSWVIYADPSLANNPEISLVIDGPDYDHLDGHCLGEVWTLHDGTKRHFTSLTVVDMADLLEVAAATLAHVRRLRPVDEGDILRVHRAACLARSVRNAPDEMTGPLVALIATDDAIAEYEIAVRDAIHVRLPNLARSLYWAGALALARSPDWVPGDPLAPHPRWPEIPARTAT